MSGDGPFLAGGNQIAGVLEQFNSDYEARLRTTSGDSVLVRFDPTATFWREGNARLRSFMLGEEVVAEGTWSGDAFHGTSLINMFVTVRDRIGSITGSTVYTERHVVQFTARTQRQAGEVITPAEASDYRVGETLEALARVDVNTGGLIAVRVFGS